jgi:hypothetical protein
MSRPSRGPASSGMRLGGDDDTEPDTVWLVTKLKFLIVLLRVCNTDPPLALGSVGVRCSTWFMYVE